MEWSTEESSSIVKEFIGFSGSKIYLVKNKDSVFVRKIGNVERNYNKLELLHKNGFYVPKIISKEGEILDMEYIHGLDIKTYLKLRDPDSLLDYIISTLTNFKKINNQLKDYSDTYVEQLSYLRNDHNLPFTTAQLINRVPKILEASLNHGDFTLENIIYSNNIFYMIDPSTGSYDSYIFDLAKLRQDLDCLWFLRNHNRKEEYRIELDYIKSELKKKFPEAFDDHLYILMLLRVYKYAMKESKEYFLILNEIYRLWKS